MKYQQLIGISILLIGTLICLQLQQIDTISPRESNLKTIVQIEGEVCTKSPIVPTGSDISNAKKLREYVANGEADMKIQDLLADQSDTNVANTRDAIIQIGMPWAVMLLLAIFQFFILNCCYCDCCPCCDRCRRTKVQKINELYISGIVFGVISAVAIGASIAGLVLTPRFADNVSSFRCLSVRTMGLISTGNDANLGAWIGLEGLITNLTGVSTQLNTFINQTNVLFTKVNATQLNNSYTSLLQTNLAIPTSLSNASYYASNSAITQIINGTITSQDNYVASQMQGTVPQAQLFNSIYSNIISQIQSIQSNGQSIVNQQGSIVSAIRSSQSTIRQANDQVISITSDFADQTQSVEDSNSQMEMGFYLYFAIALGVSLITLISITTIMFNVKFTRYFAYFTCCIYYLLVFIGFIVCVIFCILTGAMAQTCDYLYDSLQNQTEFNSISFLSGNADFQVITNQCLFGEGNLLKAYGVSGSLDTINNLTTSINTFNQAYTLYNTTLTQSVNQLRINQQLFDSLQNGSRVDYPQGVTQNSNFIQSQEQNWQPVYQAETKTITQHQQTSKDLGSSLQNISSYISDVSAYLAQVSDPKTGILMNVNCNFIKVSANTFVDGACVSLFTISYIVYVLVALVSVSLFVSLFIMFKILVGYYIFNVSLKTIDTIDQYKPTEPTYAIIPQQQVLAPGQQPEAYYQQYPQQPPLPQQQDVQQNNPQPVSQIIQPQYAQFNQKY